MKNVSLINDLWEKHNTLIYQQHDESYQIEGKTYYIIKFAFSEVTHTLLQNIIMIIILNVKNIL